MGFMSDISRLMKVATKPDRTEMWLVIRVTAIGMIGLGMLGFIIQIAGNIFSQSFLKSGSTSQAATGAFIHLLTLLMPILKRSNSVKQSELFCNIYCACQERKRKRRCTSL